MLTTSAFEEIIEIASAIKGCLEHLYETYGRLPAVIREEHGAIEKGDLQAIEKTRETKEALGLEVERHFQEMTRLTGRLAHIHHKAIDSADEVGEPPKQLGMHAVVARLEELAPLGPGGLASDVLRHLIPGLSEKTRSFESRMREIQPLVDMNKYLVESLLTNYRESYLFWQTAVEETQTPYDAHGVRRTKGRGSGFVAKA